MIWDRCRLYHQTAEKLQLQQNSVKALDPIKGSDFKAEK